MIMTVCQVLVLMLNLWIGNGKRSCLSSKSCFNETIIVNGGVLLCSAHASCAYSPNITVLEGSGTGRTGCVGSRSCQSCTIYTSDASDQDMNGYLALAWTDTVDMYKGINTNHELECDGEGTCYKIGTIRIDDDIDCWSFRSCDSISNITIESQPITVHAIQALQHSTIHTRGSGSGNETTVINMDGFFAGFNTSIYCTANNSCVLNCYENGCENLNYFCHDDVLSCSVNCDDNNNDAYVVCPNGWKNGIFINNSMVLIDYNNYISGFINQTYNTVAYYFWRQMNNLLDNYLMYNYIERIEDDDDDNNRCNIKCYAENDTCSNIDLNYSANGLCCDARRICNSSKIYLSLNWNSNSNYSNLSKEFNIYCNAASGCEYITLYQLIGYSSKSYGYSYSYSDNSSVDIYCRGSTSCQAGNIFITSDTASMATIGINKIICSGSRSCRYALIKNVDKVACLSFESCLGSTIYNTRYIFSAGIAAIGKSNIYTNGTDLDFYLFGYDSSKLFTIYCQLSDICNIYCFSIDSCNTDAWKLECSPNATCNFIYLSTLNSSDYLYIDSSDNDYGKITTKTPVTNNFSINTATMDPDVSSTEMMMHVSINSTIGVTENEDINNDPNPDGSDEVDWQIWPLIGGVVLLVCLIVVFCTFNIYKPYKMRIKQKKQGLDKLKRIESMPESNISVINSDDENENENENDNDIDYNYNHKLGDTYHATNSQQQQADGVKSSLNTKPNSVELHTIPVASSVSNQEEREEEDHDDSDYDLDMCEQGHNTNNMDGNKIETDTGYNYRERGSEGLPHNETGGNTYTNGNTNITTNLSSDTDEDGNDGTNENETGNNKNANGDDNDDDDNNDADGEDLYAHRTAPTRTKSSKYKDKPKPKSKSKSQSKSKHNVTSGMVRTGRYYGSSEGKHVSPRKGDNGNYNKDNSNDNDNDVLVKSEVGSSVKSKRGKSGKSKKSKSKSKRTTERTAQAMSVVKNNQKPT